MMRKNKILQPFMFPFILGLFPIASIAQGITAKTPLASDIPEIKASLPESKEQVLDAYEFKVNDRSYLEIAGQKAFLAKHEHFFKRSEDAIVTILAEDERDFITYIYEHTENQRVKKLELPLEGETFSTEEGLCFLDFSHGQGCSYDFYSSEYHYIRSYKPYQCFSFTRHLVTNEFIIIVTEKEHDSKLAKISLLAHSGELIREKEYEVPSTGISGVFYENGHILILHSKAGPGELLKSFNTDLDQNFTIDLGFVVRHEIATSDQVFSYLTPTKLIVTDIKSGKKRWESPIERSVVHGIIQNGKAIAVISRATKTTQLTTYDIEEGRRLKTETINGSIKSTPHMKIMDSAEGYLLVNDGQLTKLSLK